MIPTAALPGFDPGGAFPIELIFAGVVVFVAVGALARERERPYSAAIAYLALGALAALGIGALDLDWLNPFREAKVIEHIAVFALIVALFGSGLRLRRPVAGSWRPVAVLIVVVMPLTIAAIAAFGVYAMGLGLGVAVILGGTLAPTDPVLAGDVGAGPPGTDVEAGPRQHVTGEAGLNDSLAGPFVLLGVLIAERPGEGWIVEWVASDVLYAVSVAAVLGYAAGRLMSAAMSRLRESELLAGELEIFFALAGVVLTYGVVAALDAYGLLAVFVAGVGFRGHETKREYHRRVHDGSRVAENILELVAIFVLGTLVSDSAFDAPGLAGWLLVPLLLVVVRPALVLALLRPVVPRMRDRLFVGWFGVKGIASVYYVAFVIGAGVIPATEQATVLWTVGFTVIASILLHGVTATPVARRLLQ